uniref:Uncharacterized protein n=1 Tax=Romanomermis culicivorax TaxID=13658 RepID=A0A915L4B7_ROMCU
MVIFVKPSQINKIRDLSVGLTNGHSMATDFFTVHDSTTTYMQNKQQYTAAVTCRSDNCTLRVHYPDDKTKTYKIKKNLLRIIRKCPPAVCTDDKGNFTTNPNDNCPVCDYGFYINRCNFWNSQRAFNNFDKGLGYDFAEFKMNECSRILNLFLCPRQSSGSQICARTRTSLAHYRREPCRSSDDCPMKLGCSRQGSCLYRKRPDAAAQYALFCQFKADCPAFYKCSKRTCRPIVKGAFHVEGLFCYSDSDCPNLNFRCLQSQYACLAKKNYCQTDEMCRTEFICDSERNQCTKFVRTREQTI